MKKHLITAVLCGLTATPAMAAPNGGFFGGDFLSGAGNGGFGPMFMQSAFNQMAGGFSGGGGFLEGFEGFGGNSGGGFGQFEGFRGSFGGGSGQFEGFRGSFGGGFGQFPGFGGNFGGGFGQFPGFGGNFGGGFGQFPGFGGFGQFAGFEGSFGNFFGDSNFDFQSNGFLGLVTAFGGTGPGFGFGDNGFSGFFATWTSFGGDFNPNVTQPGASPVPIPAAVWLLGSGLVGLVGIARRKRNML